MPDALIGFGIVCSLLYRLSMVNWSFFCGFVIGCAVMIASLVYAMNERFFLYTAHGIDCVERECRWMFNTDLGIGDTLRRHGLVAAE